MKVGIVGSEGIKFTPETKQKAIDKIRELLTRPGVTEVVSGGCHLGGIDIWAEEVGHELGLVVTVFHPAQRTWEDGYKPRNLQIATYSDEVHCITVKVLPASYHGMRFTHCYHCGTDSHVKSGGCWTMHRAKHGFLHIIE